MVKISLSTVLHPTALRWVGLGRGWVCSLHRNISYVNTLLFVVGDLANGGGRGVCEPYSLNAPSGVCRTTATIGLELLFVDKSVAQQEDYDRKMRDIELAIADYSDECRDVFFEYLCVTNFPQCDLSHSRPRPLLVSTHE